ncbi:cAMP-dependent protein kinase regulatory subunit (PKA regulatory subunit) [Reticulomyxa filosa]|uniref:cAMP-dependent protein kinase regulatory subunit (PKA regulatory subunit) n=1 Tax=Reticulomyxa filosa TaxID=46433 RepID=X6MU37_RETFI|nr:cAMP-dependent protein kinase regulatory subunit (PKA regulatory subunit) [Reticulomyxa filosa]|eukprot:ETO17344.1 cAMP-dependent protein kinase regulatory subunit (PKA regulatory subunit) [Reticulomyxa filosa]
MTQSYVFSTKEQQKNKRGNKNKETKEKCLILESVPLLSGLGKSEREKLAEGLKHQEFQKGEYIMKEGEEGDSFYIIVSVSENSSYIKKKKKKTHIISAEQYKIIKGVNVFLNPFFFFFFWKKKKGAVEVSTEQGGKLATLKQGDYAGEQALLQNTRRNANLIATELTKCLVCNRKLFEKTLHGNPQIRFANRQAHRNAFLTPLKESADSKEDDGDKKQLTPEQMQWLLDRVANHDLFNDYELLLKMQIIGCFELKEYKKDQYCIRQGDIDHCFYVVESGHFDCLVDGVKVTEYRRGGTFGELALLYSQPRQASIVATEKSQAWEIHQSEFLRVRKQFHRKLYAEHLEFLKKVTLFHPLLQSELERVCDTFQHKHYQKGAIIFSEGDPGDKFYVIRSVLSTLFFFQKKKSTKIYGIVRWSKKSGEFGELKECDLFGERALRTNEPRAATLVVSS